VSDFTEFKNVERSGWNAQGDSYHLGTENLTGTIAPDLLDMAQIEKGDKVAIIACGPGYGMDLATDLGAEPLGVDFSEVMLVTARQRYPGYQFEQGDAEDLKYDDNSFDGFIAIDDVSLNVEKGQMACIIGPNGAGKSTMFNLITGHLTPTMGKVFFHDRDITGLAPHTICQLGMGRSFQRTNIFPRLSVFENVQVAVLAHARKTLNFLTPAKNLVQEETYALLENVNLADEAQSSSGNLSYGYQKQLELAITLASEPEILLLDEPTAGMSPQETAGSIELVERIARERGLTLLFTEHDMDVVFSVADKITVLHQGRVLAEGKPAEVRENPDVQRIYLGEAA
jgi:branched-chain amino acid transport system ATP-binding protein